MKKQDIIDLFGEFHTKNPKIDLFANGIYQYSTQYYSRVRDAKQAYINRLIDNGVSVKNSNITAKIDKRG